MERLELVIRNAEEVVTLDELKALMEGKERPRAYVGYEPSGKVHMGHMLTANKLIDLQAAGFQVVVLLADLHAYLNEKGTLEEVRATADYKPGLLHLLRPSTRKRRSAYGPTTSLAPEYVKNVLKMARNTTLNRARRSMDEVGRNMDNPHVSQMIYPLMQAVDIAALRVDLAVGGIDQRKIHMLAREEMPKLGLQPPVCPHTPIISGLNGGKMSSSKGNYISVDDSAEDLEKKIISAYCPAKDIEGNPVTELFKYHILPRLEAVTIRRPEKFGGDVTYDKYEALEADYLAGKMHPLDLKKSAVEHLNAILEPVRQKMG